MARPIVRVPSRTLDRRPSFVAIGVAVVGFIAGVSVVRSTIDPARSHSRATSIEPTAADARAPDDVGAAPRPNERPEPAAAREPEPAPSEAPPTQAAETASAEPSPAPPLAPDPTRRIQPGRIAYLRCDGAPPVRGPYPCPRDLALEEAAWAVIGALPACATAPPGHGTGDVRLEIVPGQPTEVWMRDARPDEQPLDQTAVLSCLAGPLAGLRTEIRSSHLLVSFRFAVEPR